MVKKPPRPRGRPPAGPSGEATSGYPMLTVRLPPATKATLKALALQQTVPLWRVVEQAVAAYVATLPADERRLLGQLARRAERGGGRAGF